MMTTDTHSRSVWDTRRDDDKKMLVYIVKKVGGEGVGMIVNLDTNAR